ncbi:hypothetical protein BD626DRAFT_411084 [Schizophyllum amplum]|uniref:C3H1-type domain-containing protein n=1 Tax=Schizophyllum amplum TaxID=97359 RepID=A0A550BZP2_9AGAR|nr:hypothetical protein BD626DRAFT_411084 [Auriculariopsis ampla]
MSEDPRLDRYVELCKTYYQQCRYYEAELAATRALTFNPMHLNVRYTRGNARKMAKNYHGALADYAFVNATNPKFKRCASAIEQVSPLADAAGPPPEDADYDFPQTYAGCEDWIAQHIGDDRYTSTAPSCRFNNHDGCARGEACTFSHAPDEKSVRDAGGQNVCLHFLLGDCRFGDDKCIYSHRRKDLPAGGWWDDAHQTDIVRKHVRSSLRKAAKPSFRGQRGSAHRRGPSSSSSKFYSGPAFMEMDDFDDDYYANGGFSNEDIMELACQGIKPWDDDAGAALAVLNYY